MPRQYWRSSVPPFDQGAGTAYNTSVTLTDVSPAPQVTLPGYTLLERGVEVFIEAWAEFSVVAATTPTLLLGFYYGGVAGVALAATTAIATASGIAGAVVHLEYHGIVRALGSAGSIWGSGYVDFPTSLTAVTRRPIPETLAARTVTIDTTVAKTITLGAQWGTSAAGNTLTCQDLSLDLVN
jgi:hypothetical protein